MLSTESVRVALEPILSRLCGPVGVGVLARMVTGIILSGVATYAGAAREHTAVMRRVAAEIKRYCRVCHWPTAKLDLLRSSLVHLLASQASQRIVVAVDWTDVQEYSVLVFAVIIGRRTVPIYWVAAPWHADHLEIERQAFEEVRGLIPPGLDCIILGDRGFGTTRTLRLLQILKYLFVLRTKWSRILIRRPSRSEEFVAMERITYPAGKVQDLGEVEFTVSQAVVVRLVRFRDTRQKGMWVLATTLDAPGRAIVNLYAHRFLIEETFKDYKDVRSGWQLAGTSVESADVLSWMFGIVTLAYLIATLVGVDARARNWHHDYQSNRRGRELAHFRLGRLVARDVKRGFRYDAERLNRTMPKLALRLGRWDWVHRPHEVLETWSLETLPLAPEDAGQSEPKPRTERPCDRVMCERLRQLFTEKGITQVQVTEALDRTQGQVCHVLQGRSSLPRHWIPKIAALLEMSVEDLVSDTGWTGSERRRRDQDRTEPQRKKRSRKTPSTVLVEDAALSSTEEGVPAEATDTKSYPGPEQDDALRTLINRLRREKGIRQSDIARAVGYTQGTLSRVLSGKRPLPHHWLPALSDLLGLELASPLASACESGESAAVPPASPGQVASAIDPVLVLTDNSSPVDDTSQGEGAVAPGEDVASAKPPTARTRSATRRGEKSGGGLQETSKIDNCGDWLATKILRSIPSMNVTTAPTASIRR